MNKHDIVETQKVIGAIIKELPEKTYLKKDIKLIMLNLS